MLNNLKIKIKMKIEIRIKIKICLEKNLYQNGLNLDEY